MAALEAFGMGKGGRVSHGRGRASGLRAWSHMLALACVTACASPTLPLPPPEEPSVAVGTEPGTFLLWSDHGVEPEALVLVVNRNETLPANRRVTGTFADAQGSWKLQVYAQPGDVVDISQETADAKSSTVEVTLR